MITLLVIVGITVVVVAGLVATGALDRGPRRVSRTVRRRPVQRVVEEPVVARRVVEEEIPVRRVVD